MGQASECRSGICLIELYSTEIPCPTNAGCVHERKHPILSSSIKSVVAKLEELLLEAN
uniref:Uncharacterized protein n=1 Tax=Setaria digitata TaxID=48799 RepID=A0A915Q1J7_9BILA